IATASGMLLHVTSGMGIWLPKAILSLGRVNWIGGRSFIASAIAFCTAMFTPLAPAWGISVVVSGQSGSARQPDIASCLVVMVSVAVRFLSLVPVLPAIGCLMMS